MRNPSQNSPTTGKIWNFQRKLKFQKNSYVGAVVSCDSPPAQKNPGKCNTRICAYLCLPVTVWSCWACECTTDDELRASPVSLFSLVSNSPPFDESSSFLPTVMQDGSEDKSFRIFLEMAGIRCTDHFANYLGRWDISIFHVRCQRSSFLSRTYADCACARPVMNKQ